MDSKLAKAALVFSTVLLCSCIVPEKFIGKYTLSPNGDYSFVYDGTMVNSMARMAAMEAKEKGKKPSAKDEAGMRDMANKFSKNTRIKEFTEVSFDTWRVRTEEKGNLKAEQSVPFWDAQMRFFTLRYDAQNSTASFVIKPFSAKDLKAFDELGITPDWKLQIATDCAVLSSTVKLDKSFFSNTYTFSVSRDDLTNGVTVVFQFPPLDPTPVPDPTADASTANPVAPAMPEIATPGSVVTTPEPALDPPPMIDVAEAVPIQGETANPAPTNTTPEQSTHLPLVADGKPKAAAHPVRLENDTVELVLQVLAPGKTIEAVRIDNLGGVSSLWRSDGKDGGAPLSVSQDGNSLSSGTQAMNLTLGDAETLLSLSLKDNGAFSGKSTEFRVTVFFVGGERVMCALGAKQ